MSSTSLIILIGAFQGKIVLRASPNFEIILARIIKSLHRPSAGIVTPETDTMLIGALRAVGFEIEAWARLLRAVSSTDIAVEGNPETTQGMHNLPPAEHPERLKWGSGLPFAGAAP